MQEREWDSHAWQVLKQSKGRATATGTTDVLLLAYDKARSTDRHSGMDATICNVSKMDGSVCRMPRGHTDAHVAFSGELIAVTGVYVIDRVVK